LSDDLILHIRHCTKFSISFAGATFILDQRLSPGSDSVNYLVCKLSQDHRYVTFWFCLHTNFFSDKLLSYTQVSFYVTVSSWRSHTNRNCANWTQNSHLKLCISWGLGDWQPYPI